MKRVEPLMSKPESLLVFHLDAYGADFIGTEYNGGGSSHEAFANSLHIFFILDKY